MRVSFITQKILRLAWDIYENNFDEKELVLVGIGEKDTWPNGKQH